MIDVLLFCVNNEVTSGHISPSLECSHKNINSWTFTITVNIAFPMIIKIFKCCMNAIETFYFHYVFLMVSNGKLQKQPEQKQNNMENNMNAI